MKEDEWRLEPYGKKGRVRLVFTSDSGPDAVIHLSQRQMRATAEAILKAYNQPRTSYGWKDRFLIFKVTFLGGDDVQIQWRSRRGV